MQTTQTLRNAAAVAVRRDPLIGLTDEEVDGYAELYRRVPGFIRETLCFGDFTRLALMLRERDFAALANRLTNSAKGISDEAE